MAKISTRTIMSRGQTALVLAAERAEQRRAVALARAKADFEYQAMLEADAESLFDSYDEEAELD